MEKQSFKENKGITLVALVITIIVLLILSGMTFSSGKKVIDSAKLEKFSAELQIMQTEVNSLYQQYEQGDETVLSLGKELEETEEVATAFNGAEETDTTGYRIYTADTLQGLGIEEIKQDFLVNVETRKVISIQGLECDGETYYTIEQIPENLYNVATKDIQNEINFDLSYSYSASNFQLDITNITYKGNVKKGTIYYGQEQDGKINWKAAIRNTTNKSYEIPVTSKGTWYVKIEDVAGNSSEEKSIGVTGVKAGDYVDYTPTSGTYTMSSTYSGYDSDQEYTTEDLGWRVLNVNNDGTVDLISSKPTSAYIYFLGALGYNNGVYLLNEMCSKLYSNTTKQATARSINIEDIQDKMDLSVWDYQTDINTQYGVPMTYTSIMEYPYKWSQQNISTDKIDGIAINGTLGESDSGKLTTETYLEATTSITTTQTYWRNSMTSNNYIDSIYYEMYHAADFYYMLASRCTLNYENYSYFGLRRVGNTTVSGRYMFGRR